MKKNIILLLVSIVLFTGCDESDLKDQGIDFDIIPGTYVAFNPDGVVNTLSAFDIDETTGTQDINIEIPNNVNSYDDTSVSYIFGGTAVYGIDFTIDGASASGGTIVIPHTQGTDPDSNLADNIDLTINVLRDDASDDDKTLTITLVDATSPDGEVSVGRPDGLLTTATVNITDIDIVTFSAASEEITVSEDTEATVTVTIETADRSTDATVVYSLGGTAVYGVDYTIVGGTATGDTVVIDAEGGVDGTDDFVELEIIIIDDLIADGEKTIVITIDEATGPDPLTLDIDVSTITIEDNE